MSLRKFQEVVKDRKVWCAAVHEITEFRLSGWTTNAELG